MSLEGIVQLLQTALLLLALTQNPNVPESLKAYAVTVANQAIAVATQAVSRTPTTSPGTVLPPVTVAPNPTLAPNPSRLSTQCPIYQQPLCPIGQYVEQGTLASNGCRSAPRCVQNVVIPPTTPPAQSLTSYTNFTNICERRVVDYQNGMNVLSPVPAGCFSPNNPFLFSVTHESALNTHWRLDADGTKIYDANFVGDSAIYMHDYRDSDLGVIFRHGFTPNTGGVGTVLGIALDALNFPGTNVTGRDFRDGYLFMGLNDLSIPTPSLSKDIYVSFAFRIRGNDLVPYEGAASNHRLVLGTKVTWTEVGRANTAHYFEFNLFKSPGFHATQTNYPCPSDGLAYDYCFYDSSAAGLYAEGKYIPISSVAGHNALSNITTDTWYSVRIPLSQLVRNSGWFSPPSTWSAATLDGVYIGIESSGASRLWAEVKNYSVTDE